ncbi:unnamed protein product [Acanthoscelides obtectus]|uniref:RING-type domain-containing protein n=1 Tax=Acanthoscelides obtectus TaxID=200917 RepID=A0A9P0LPU0_ACAOB|nr:unnamed protein product [Acanthoscelides obtectus]CAK1681289.1 Breast cancer type 1 susceptibility protein homolog [Acanthoscelides obtectus]
MNKQDPKLKRFASLIHKLKTLLKCPICLDVIQEAVELDCCHKLCDSCYHELVSKEMLKHCPICKATLKKPSTLYKDKYSDTIGKFVSVMGMQLENVYKLKVEALADAPQIDESNLTARVSKDVPKAINHRESNKPNKENVIVRKLPVRQAKPAEYLKTNLKIDNIPKNSQNSSEDDLFDKILGTSNTMRLNKKGTKTIYTNKQKINKKTEDEYRVLDFDDDETKQAVLNWLNDTRNHFDRLTQTQMMEPSHDEQGIDLPSVSQPNKRVKKRRRVRSLDFEKEKRPVTSKRYSDGHVMEPDNYNIENPNTEGLILEEKLVEKAQQNVILHILEDEYLNKLEYEMVAPENNEVKEKNTGIAGVSLSSCNSGWNRITEIKETADKGGKVPKQLNIKLQNVEKTSPRNNEMVDFQQYKDQSPTEAAKQQQSPKLNKDILPEIQSSENVATPKSLYADIPANTLSKRQIVETDAATENKSTLPYVHGESANTTSPINEKDKVANKKICKSPLYKLQHKSDYISSRNNTQTDNTKAIQTSIGMADQNIHHATILPNHKNTPDGSVTKDVTALQNEDDESFGDYDIPTQKITAVCDSKFCEPVKKLLDFISEYVQTCLKEVDLEGALNAIDKIKAYVDRLKNNNVVHTSVQTSPVSKRDVFVETRLQTYDEAVQTGEVLKKMCSVQTFETFKKDAILQTESLSLKNVIENTLKSSQLLEKNMLNKCQENKANRNVEDELLTNSLDAIDFNTLDIVKNSHRVESSFDEKMQEMAASPRKRYVHQKIVRVPKVPNNRKDVKDKLPPEIKEGFAAILCAVVQFTYKKCKQDKDLEFPSKNILS